MARSNFIRGPAADFTMPTTQAVIPGLSVFRAFGDGEILILTGCKYTAPGTNAVPTLDITLDGGRQLSNLNAQETATASFNFHLTRAYLLRASPGLHTIETVVLNGAGNGGTVTAGGAYLIVVELPNWDNSADFTFLA